MNLFPLITDLGVESEEKPNADFGKQRKGAVSTDKKSCFGGDVAARHPRLTATPSLC